MEYYPAKKLKRDTSQPRKYIDKEYVESLSKSIKTEGIINPIEVDENDVIITGEMRWRGALKAGLTKVPITRVKGINKEERFLRQIHENVHRGTMSSIDLAEAIKKVKTFPGFETHEDVEKKIGVAKSTITGYLRLLKEPEEVKKALSTGKIQAKSIRFTYGLPQKEKEEFRKFLLENPMKTRIAHRLLQIVRTAISRKETAKLKKVFALDFSDPKKAIGKAEKIIESDLSVVMSNNQRAEIVSRRITDLMEAIEENPPESFDPYHRGMLLKDFGLLFSQVSHQNLLSTKTIKQLKERA